MSRTKSRRDDNEVDRADRQRALDDLNYKPTQGPAPSDTEASIAWDQIMALAEKNALIIQAYGGVATLAVPCEQRKAGLREQVLRTGLFELEKKGGRT